METSSIILFAEIALILVLGLGWVFGSRRLNLKRHHRAIYSVLGLHLITVFLWMIPSGSNWIWNPSSGSWLLFVHAILGIIPIILGIIVIIAFIITPGMPLQLLRKAKPAMIAILILWVVAFILGLAIYSDWYL